MSAGNLRDPRESAREWQGNMRGFSNPLGPVVHIADPRGVGGGLYRYVPPQRVWCLSRFGLKTGIDFEVSNKQGTANENAASIRRICKRSDQPFRNLSHRF